MQILKEQLIEEIGKRSKTLNQTHIYKDLESKGIDTLRFYIYELKQTKTIQDNWDKVTSGSYKEEDDRSYHEIFLDNES